MKFELTKFDGQKEIHSEIVESTDSQSAIDQAEATLTAPDRSRYHFAARESEYATASDVIANALADLGPEQFRRLLVDYTKHGDTEIDDDGDVWDGRGYWWSEEHVEKFSDWLKAR